MTEAQDLETRLAATQRVEDAQVAVDEATKDLAITRRWHRLVYRATADAARDVVEVEKEYDKAYEWLADTRRSLRKLLDQEEETI